MEDPQQSLGREDIALDNTDPLLPPNKQSEISELVTGTYIYSWIGLWGHFYAEAVVHPGSGIPNHSLPTAHRLTPELELHGCTHNGQVSNVLETEVWRMAADVNPRTASHLF